MANRVYIIPRRNDLAGAALYLKLKPIAGQKNDIYDGEHQDFYLRYSFDVPGLTVTANGAYVSGSLSTTPLGALAVVDTDGNMVNDASVTQAPEFGLEAYLQDRVTNAINEPLPLAECAAARAQILARVFAGADLDEIGINAAIAAAVTAVASGVANSYELSAAGGLDSFGTVEDVLRILSGEAYMAPEDTIIADQANAFLGLAARDALVAAAVVAGNDQYGSHGRFLASDEAGYRPMPVVAQTGALLSSLQMPGGQLYELDQHNLTLLNANSFAYTAADVDHWHPRAQTLNVAGAYAAIAATGTARVLRVYRNDGTCLGPVIP